MIWTFSPFLPTGVGNRRWIFLLLPAFCLSACEPWELDQQDFIRVELTALETLSIDSVRISGSIDDLMIGPVRDHGIIWSALNTIPTVFDQDGKVSLGVKTAGQAASFTEELQVSPNTAYTFRIYATLDGQQFIYSDPIAYESGTGTVATLSIDYQKAYELNISGRLSGTEKGITAIQHGFCWSTDRALPSLRDTFVNLGVLRNNDPFHFTITRLTNEENLFLRAYAIFQFDFKSDTVYGNVLTFDGDLNFWKRKADFPGDFSIYGVGLSFSIGQSGYFKPEYRVFEGNVRKDFWEYDAVNDTWTQKADFAGAARIGGVAIAIGQKGYIGLGTNQAHQLLQDFWEYDPGTDTWMQKADFAGHAREHATGFGFSDKGYVGLGRSDSTDFSIPEKSFWEYDPEGDQWTRKADFTGPLRTGNISFSAMDKAYLGLGVTGINIMLNDFWEYDPALDSWSQKADFAGGPRVNAVGFSIAGKSYAGLGIDVARRNDFWEYDPQLNVWIERADFTGIRRFWSPPSLSFSLNGKGYIGCGYNNNDNNIPVALKDLWEFDP